MSHSYRDDQSLNPAVAGHKADQPSFTQVLQARWSRRDVLAGGAAWMAKASLPLSAASLASLSACATHQDSSLHRSANVAGPRMGFKGVAVSTSDSVQVPEGYTASVLLSWGDAIGHRDGSPVFRDDASNSAADQMLQAGMHHDGLHFFALPRDSRSSSQGLLAINHEYTDDGLLHSDGYAGWSAEKVRKSQAAHGVSVVEVRRDNDQWRVVRPSPLARRITAFTPTTISGPAAGSQGMRTAADPSGRECLGTLNNCANGSTVWGSYLTCEENWDTYFANSGSLSADHVRNGITNAGRGYRWHEFDQRFDAGLHPNEPNRFGWVVEIDPYDPQSKPVKRTALGRFSHEGAFSVVGPDGRITVYMGDDRQFEYIYKFVSRDAWNAKEPTAKGNASLLDHGTLYVARFDADGSGQWLPLVFGNGPLTAAAGFADQADVLIRTRAAADALKATPMDRPEWIAVHPQTREVYCTLTNNSRRGAAQVAGVDQANPRASNTFGHIIRWREQGNDPASTRFQWDIFVLAGDPQHPDANKRGNIHGDAFGSPDGLWFDESGLLWIQTDVSTSVLNKGDYARLGNNQMLVADVRSGEIRRFLTGPKGCEITGAIMTPDQRNLFINIQHPGETSSERNDPAKPKAVSSWPQGEAGGRPRSSTVVIRRKDGGVIGS